MYLGLTPNVCSSLTCEMFYNRRLNTAEIYVKVAVVCGHKREIRTKLLPTKQSIPD